MNIKKSGKAPDRIKAALLAALLITFTGCNGGTSSTVQPSGVQTEAPPGGDTSETSEQSSTEETHTPDTSDTSDPPDNSSDIPDSSDNSESSSESVPQTSETSEPTSEMSEESSEPVSSTESTSMSSEPPESSSEQSSSSIDPNPPPEIIIPDVKVPTSPGMQLITGTNGVIDYSNAAQGYVSAKYTGSSVKVKFRIETNGQQVNLDLDPNGAVEYYALTYGSGTYTLTIFEQIPGSTGYAVAAQGSFDVRLDDPLLPFLYPNRYVNYNQNSEVVYKAAELCAGKTSAIDKIAAIFTWVAENVSYDYDLAATVTSGYTPVPDTTLSRRKGICFDYSALMAAMLRSQSIPTRLAIGNASPDIYHAWNEVYTEETGWITPELLLSSAGYNLVDATFYSSSPNKQQIADYISNGANYYVERYY